MKTYINISITYFGSRRIAPEVHYYRNDGINTPVSTFDKLTVLEANKLMWELVKLGGTNSFSLNRYNNGICTRSVEFYGQL